VTYAAGSIWWNSDTVPPRQVVSDDGTSVVYRAMVPARSDDANYMRCAPDVASSVDFAAWAREQRQSLEALIDTWDEAN
jgi:hypothetical protein